MSGNRIRLPARVISRLKRFKRKYPKLSELYHAARSVLVSAEPPGIETWVRPISLHRSVLAEPRINLLLPSVNPEREFGGVSTALKFFDDIRGRFGHARLIVSDEPGPEALARFRDFRYGSDDDPQQTRQLVWLNEAGGQPLSVAPGDTFIATYWTTAYLALNWIIPWQSREYHAAPRPIVYLIQDYEPGFFAWSSEFLLARSTYLPQTPVIGVFNTRLVHDYFRNQQHRFAKEYCFEPKLNPVLRGYLPESGAGPPKEKQILIYGRPGNPRNAFSLIKAGLDGWRSRCADARGWKAVSAGVPHKAINLRDDVIVEPLGKLSLDRYAEVLLRSSVGVSLMISPHPSYPPLEMAHFGLWVVTNDFADKDMSKLHDNFLSLDNCNPSTIADAIVTACGRVRRDRMSGYQGRTRMPSYLDDSAMFPFLDELVANVQTYSTVH